ncbi:MAG: LysR family transcriptional regulator [Sphingobium sp.]
MRYRALDTNLLVMLDILLDTASITRTAELLGLTQPAVSSALGRLRDHFDDELLVQIGRINRPTALAERIRDDLKDVLARTDALISLRAGFDPMTDKRHFSFVGSDYVATTFGGEILRQVALAGPRLTAHLELLGLNSIDDFERGGIDVAIFPRELAYPDHPTDELFEERFVCVIWDRHPEISDSISQEQYLNARHVVHHSVNGGRKLPILDQWFLAQSSIKRQVAVRVPSFAHILPILPGTPFVATIQQRLATEMSHRFPIRILPAPFDFPPLRIVMQWHRHLDKDIGVQWFRAKVTETVARLCL